MSEYLELTEQLKESVENLNQLLQGDENTTVTINGVEKPSLEKKTVDTLNSLVQLLVDAVAEIDGLRYETVESGLSLTPDGDYFSVVSPDDEEYLLLYRNEAGNAVYKKAYPTKEFVERKAQELTVSLNKVNANATSKISLLLSDDDVLFSLQDLLQREVLFVSNDGALVPHKIKLPESATVGDSIHSLKELIMDKISQDSGDMLVIEDITGRILARFSNDGTFYPSKLDPKLIAPITDLSEDSGNLFVLEDTSGRVLARFSKDGTFYPLKLDPKLIPPITDLSIDSDDLLVIEDKSGRVLARFSKDGTFYPSKLDPSLIAKNYSNYLPEIVGNSLYLNNLDSGHRELIYTGDAPSNPQVLDNGTVTFYAGQKAMVFDIEENETASAFPIYEIAAFGDSITAAGWIKSVVEPALNVPCYNMGRGGYGCADIAIRQGGLIPTLNVANNTIPASGAVQITDVKPETGYSPYTITSLSGSISGVHGVLSRSNITGSWTFTRDVEGEEVNVPDQTQFLSSEASTYENMVQTIFMGRNNVLSETFESDLLRDVEGCVANLKPHNKRFVVVSVTNGQTEPSGSLNYKKIVSANEKLSQLYGDYFFDLRKHLIDHGLDDAGLEATPDDELAISEDRIPPSLLNDNVHPNAIGYQVVGGAIISFLKNKGWF